MGQPDTQAWTDLQGRYLSITSFRRDGTGVATPVWFVRDGARLLVQTDANSYKVQRIRHNPHVTIAICNAAGRLRGQPVSATATLLPAAELPRAEQLLAAKYRIDLILFKPLRAIQTWLGRRRGPSIGLAITPEPDGPHPTTAFDDRAFTAQTVTGRPARILGEVVPARQVDVQSGQLEAARFLYPVDKPPTGHARWWILFAAAPSNRSQRWRSP